MKKIIMTVAVAVLAAATVSAQNLSVGAGYLNSTLASKSGDTVTKGAYQGFYAGAGASILNKGAFAITPGVYFEYLSASDAASFYGIVGATTTATEMYLNVPVDFSYGIDLGGAKISVFAGPTLSIGMLSNIKIEGTGTVSDIIASLGGNTNGEIDRYGEKSNYGRFDVMIGGGIAVDFAKCIRVSAGYNYGLLDRDGSDSIKLNRSELHAGIAYLF